MSLVSELSNGDSQEKKYTKTVGMLVGALVIFQMYSYVSGSSKKNPEYHTLGLIAGYTLVIPYILRLSPEWYSQPMQIFVTLMIVILDWFSFHEDKSRFSEEELCIFGNCRFNARVTGHLAHIIDAISVGLMIIPNVEDEKCLQARIMRDPWRGGLNDMITGLGILLAWQSFFSCDNDMCTSKFFPANQAKNLVVGIPKQETSKKLFMLSVARVVVLQIGMAIVPTYVNYINTSYQHGKISSEEYGIPSCFDD